MMQLKVESNLKIKRLTPKLVSDDPYLKDYEQHIIDRIKGTNSRLKDLTGGTKSLLSFAYGYNYFGLHKNSKGWIFREWAPNVTSVYIVGNFSNWEAQEEFALNRVSDDGNWEITMPADLLKHGDYYRLKLFWDGGSGDRIPSYANYVVQDNSSHIFNCIVWDPENPYEFKIENFTDVAEMPVIYEAHIGMAQEKEGIGTYNEFRENVLPRIKEAGYNTIQLMAIHEHPYYGSFGYQVSSFFAPCSRFGTIDELKQLVDEAHLEGLTVIMDLVHSHAVKNEVEGLSRFDGTLHQYFHDGDRGQHIAWDTRCFDYGKNQVLHFLLSNCAYWMREFKFDGFRFDGVTSMLYHHHGLCHSFNNYGDYFDSGVDHDAAVYLSLANKLIHQIKKNAITIAEDVSGLPGVAVPLNDGGLGFDYRLAMGIPDFWIKLIKEKKDEEWSVSEMFHEMTNRRKDENVISYCESHDQALVGDKTIVFRLIDKEMYTNMSKCNRNMIVDRGITLVNMIKLLTMTTAKGGYLNFMGNEFGHPEWIDFPRSFNDWSYFYARRQWNLRENTDLCYDYIGKFDKDIIKFICENRLLISNDFLLNHLHEDDHVLAFSRKNFIFVFNFHPTSSFVDYGIKMVHGIYKLIFASDEEKYGGYDNLKLGHIYETDKTGIASLYLPARTALILEKL